MDTLLFLLRRKPGTAQVYLAPFLHLFQDGDEALGQLRKGIFHLGRYLLVNLAVDPAIVFQFPELLCQCLLRDLVPAPPLQLPEPLDLIYSDVPHNEYLPFPSEDGLQGGHRDAACHQALAAGKFVVSHRKDLLYMGKLYCILSLLSR